MAILEKEVLVSLNNNTIDYYRNLGYKIPTYLDARGKVKIKRNTTLSVKIEDLPVGSHARLTKICDDCGKHMKNKEYKAITTNRSKTDGKDRCLKCGQIYRDYIRKTVMSYNKSLEGFAKENNKEYLLSEFSLNNKQTPINIAYGTHDKYLWNCPVCKEEYLAQVNSRTSSNTNCPLCSISKGERLIETWLQSYSFSFVSQKRFDGLIGIKGGLLSYDFYLPNNNILIEYQGEFHDGSSRGYAKVNLEKQKEHDRRKKEFAEQKRIELLEIWYWDFDIIEEILTNKLIDKRVESNIE